MTLTLSEVTSHLSASISASLPEMSTEKLVLHLANSSLAYDKSCKDVNNRECPLCVRQGSSPFSQPASPIQSASTGPQLAGAEETDRSRHLLTSADVQDLLVQYHTSASGALKNMPPKGQTLCRPRAAYLKCTEGRGVILTLWYIRADITPGV